VPHCNRISSLEVLLSCGARLVHHNVYTFIFIQPCVCVKWYRALVVESVPPGPSLTLLLNPIASGLLHTRGHSRGCADPLPWPVLEGLDKSCFPSKIFSLFSCPNFLTKTPQFLCPASPLGRSVHLMSTSSSPGPAC
jgi:hypothetical protein